MASVRRTLVSRDISIALESWFEALSEHPVMFHWLRYFLGLEEPTDRPKGETFSDAYDRGARFQEFQRSDLDPAFAARLQALCEADQNVKEMALMWMQEKDLPRELVASLRVERTGEQWIRTFVDRANALGGPCFVATMREAEGNPEDSDKRKAFYRRSA